MHSTQKLLLFHHLSIIAGLFYYGFNWAWALVIITGCVAWAYVVGHKGLHMYLAHTKYKDCIKSYLYTLGALVTGVGSPLNFAATHRQHHAFHDTDKDPHSPEHIGWYNVWFMNYNSQYISPRLVRDYLSSNFQKFMNRYWMRITIAMLVVLFLIDPRLICFVVSPFSVYTFHGSSAINVFGHLEGGPKNSWLVLLTNPWDRNHKDHHEWKF